MKKEKIDRINILYKKQKTTGLTKEEKEEQGKLRKEYIELIKSNFKNTMNTVNIKDEKGNIVSLKRD